MGFEQSKRHACTDILSDEKYELILLDMDGTLYYQRKMQMLMCLEMLGVALRHPFSLWKLRAISVFRKVREAATECLLQEHYKQTADKIKKTPMEVERVIDEWMFKRPLKYIYACRDVFLCEKMVEWQDRGRKVVVYSDYPALDKCQALKIKPDGVYSSDQERIGRMKPSAKAVEIIAGDFDVEKEMILAIGDRYSKDGKMAENAGVDYLILDKWYIKRRKKWK